MHAAFDRLQQQRTPLLSPFAPVGAPYRQPGLFVGSFFGCRCQMPLDVASGYGLQGIFLNSQKNPSTERYTT